MDILKKAVALLVVVCFLSCVFLHGDETKQFSLQIYVEKVVADVVNIVGIGNLIDVWQNETRPNGEFYPDSVEDPTTLDQVYGFFLRLADSVMVFVKSFVSIHTFVWDVLPWNSTIDTTNVTEEVTL